MVIGVSVLVVVIGRHGQGFGVGVATLLMGVVVAMLVASDELRRDVSARPRSPPYPEDTGWARPSGDPGRRDADT